ncbi:hypothetical protein DRQ32_02665 [bacterium]|nr:MAG: hypothetical protein DRQ32_02665 [bacterium]
MNRTLGWAIILLFLAAPASAQRDPMQAPPQEVLDRQSSEWIARRRWMSVIIIGSTLVAGSGASMLRRRRRKQAALEQAAQQTPLAWPLMADLMQIDPVMRTDRIRRALRAGLVPPPDERARLEQFFETASHPASRVLVLEALSTDGAPAELLERALTDSADSVRSAALHLLLLAQPERSLELARAHLHDPGIEARTQCAEVLADSDPAAAGEAMLDIVRAEALGSREGHVLRRAMGFFAEELKDPAWTAQIEALRDEVEDEEQMIDWAVEKLRGT